MHCRFLFGLFCRHQICTWSKRSLSSSHNGIHLPPLDSFPVGLETFSRHGLGEVVGVHQGSFPVLDLDGPIVDMLPEVVCLGVVVPGSGGQSMVPGQGEGGCVVNEGSGGHGANQCFWNFQVVDHFLESSLDW